MDPSKLVSHLESPYATYDDSGVPAHDVLIAGLSWETQYWPALAVQWLEQGAPVDAEIAALLEKVASQKHFPQSLRHKAFAIARRWSRQVPPNTSFERTREG